MGIWSQAISIRAQARKIGRRGHSMSRNLIRSTSWHRIGTTLSRSTHQWIETKDERGKRTTRMLSRRHTWNLVRRTSKSRIGLRSKRPGLGKAVAILRLDCPRSLGERALKTLWKMWTRQSEPFTVDCPTWAHQEVFHLIRKPWLMRTSFISKAKMATRTVYW